MFFLTSNLLQDFFKYDFLKLCIMNFNSLSFISDSGPAKGFGSDRIWVHNTVS